MTKVEVSASNQILDLNGGTEETRVRSQDIRLSD